MTRAIAAAVVIALAYFSVCLLIKQASGGQWKWAARQAFKAVSVLVLTLGTIALIVFLF